MRECKAKTVGWGDTLPEKRVEFNGQTRYHLDKDETLLMLAVRSARKVLECMAMDIGDTNCIVCTVATPLQAVSCNTALMHEQLAKGLDIPVMDIDITCTSFISALDMMLCLTEMKRYKDVLIISGDAASAALNPRQKESHELFSDGTDACVLTGAGEQELSKIPYSYQKTWSKGAHDMEIRGGGGMMSAFSMNEENREDFYFDMKDKHTLKLSTQNLPRFVEQCLKEAGVKRENIGLVVPHQTSWALGVTMPRSDFRKGTYINRVSRYGNMISISVPYAFCETIEEGRVEKRDLVLLIGTTADLTVSFLLMQI